MLDSQSGSFPKIHEDHQKLRAILSELESCDQAEEICSRADSLHPWLREHFSEEEEPSGVFATIESQDPRHSHEIRLLIEEHQSMLGGMKALAELARSVPSGDGPTPELKVSVRAIVLALRQHEKKERHLFTDAFYHEEGGGD